MLRASPGAGALNDGVALEELVRVLQCPRCCAGMALGGSAVVCQGPSGHRFGVQDGAIVLLPENRRVATMPEDHVSNAVDPAVLDWLDGLQGWSLNLGAGASTRRPARCVELENSVFVNTTVVGDAHCLPFRDDTFDAIVSFNTFEHLADPMTAAREVLRVLRPGGSLRLQTAFLQPLHEEPAHFYNTTEFGLRRWFADFDITDCFVPSEMSPAKMFAWLASHVLYNFARTEGGEIADWIGHLKLSQWARFWTDPRSRMGFIPVIFDCLPMSDRARFSAGFELRARKPLRPDDPELRQDQLRDLHHQGAPSP
jgi:SAM-dependent methyltransferase